MPYYHPIPLMPYCCVPAALQWILYRRGLDILDQETIGANLGLQLPISGKKIFRNPGIIFTDKKPVDGYGTRIHIPEYSIQKFFDKYGFKLKISDLYTFKTNSQIHDFLVENMKPENDIILRWHTRIFKGGKEPEGVGHFSVIEDYDPSDQEVVIGDPDPPFFKKASLGQLLYAMSDQVDGIQRGMYLVENA
ncbi:hypothetical protein GF376_01425 [Candidatus Peregrinibacteria bacterium]|nr:hypothetical protein [Candidatus Peregrinibacteria bacterium]